MSFNTTKDVQIAITHQIHVALVTSAVATPMTKRIKN